MASLAVAERARIVARAQAEMPHLWGPARAHAASAEHIENAVLSGAVAGALAERCDPSVVTLALLDEQGPSPGESAAELLAMVLDADHLWSVREATVIDETLGLPYPELPVASELLRAACAEFRRDARVRDELAAWLLGEAACLATPLETAEAA